MRLNFNSKDGVFAIKAENEGKKTSSKRRCQPSAISSSIFSMLKSRK